MSVKSFNNLDFKNDQLEALQFMSDKAPWLHKNYIHNLSIR